MTTPAGLGAELRVAVANLEYGGLSEAGDDSGWCKSMARLLEWQPAVVLLQELNGRAAWRLNRHVWRTANELGLTPVLGPPSPGSVSGNHPAVLVDTAAGLRIIDAGPPAWPADGTPAWCEALVRVPGMAHPVWFISVHLPARSATSARLQAERLANLTAQRGGLVVAGGDWNSYAQADARLLTPAVLAGLPAHLRPARMRLENGGALAADYGVDAALASVGLADAAAQLPAGRRTPPQLAPTGITGGGRVDRVYLTRALVPALGRYEQAHWGQRPPGAAADPRHQRRGGPHAPAAAALTRRRHRPPRLSQIWACLEGERDEGAADLPADAHAADAERAACFPAGPPRAAAEGTGRQTGQDDRGPSGDRRGGVRRRPVLGCGSRASLPPWPL